MIRSAGVLMPLTALPSNYGIGTLGKEAEKFVDFLADAGQTYWQILPLGPTGFGNSPYQPLSSYAGNPYLIDLDTLIEEGFLKKEEADSITWYKEADKVDYGILYNEREKVLKKATDRLPVKAPAEYHAFLEKESGWVKDYAVFMALKKDQKGKAWTDWPQEFRNHRSEAVRQKAEELKETVIFYERVQYFFFQQLSHIKKYANARGVQIIGDLPFYMAADSIDVWSHPEQFEIDQNGKLQEVAGMPDGQKWGNPLFNWERMRNDGYSWWMNRTEFQFRFCDVLRIDHFKGYESYYAIPADAQSPGSGRWCKGPGLELFQRMRERLGDKPLILEDLGYLTEDFKKMVKDSGYPGMRIFQYAFDPNDPGSWYMPFQYIQNSVAYTGTHDNNTIQGWIDDEEQKPRIERCMNYLDVKDRKDLRTAVLKAVYGTVSDLAIVQIQDLTGTGKESRMNDPAGSDNWTWRLSKDQLTKQIAEEVKEWMLLYCRNNWNVKERPQNV